MTELPAVIAEKQSELPDASLDHVIEELVREAATAWKAVFLLGDLGAAGARYPYLSEAFREDFRREGNPYSGCGPLGPHDPFFEKVLAYLERPNTVNFNLLALLKLANEKSRDMPSPTMVRRLRVVAAELPWLIKPISKRGAGSRGLGIWRLLWLDACGYTATKIAKQLARPFDPQRFRREWQEFGDAPPTDDDVEWGRQQHEREHRQVQRNQIWTLRARAYRSIAEQVQNPLRRQAA